MVVLYHANCPDGFASAFTAWLFHGDTARYIPVQHGQNPPQLEGEDILIVDFSYKRETLEELRRKNKSIQVLDHHETAKEHLSDLSYCLFDDKHSGCVMTWEHLFPGEVIPWFLEYVEDRDLWKWDLPESSTLNAAIGSYPLTFHDWHELFHQPKDHLLVEGRGILRYQQKIVKQSAEKARMIYFHGYEIPFLNCTQLISETLNILAQDNIFAMSYLDTEHNRAYSLRSIGDFSVRKIAEEYGGGGHRNAAGFTVPRIHSVLPEGSHS